MIRKITKIKSKSKCHFNSEFLMAMQPFTRNEYSVSKGSNSGQVYCIYFCTNATKNGLLQSSRVINDKLNNGTISAEYSKLEKTVFAWLPKERFCPMLN